MSNRQRELWYSFGGLMGNINFPNSGKNWDFIPIKEWPYGIAKDLLNNQWGYKSRFKLWTFLVGNGMDPKNVKENLGNILGFIPKEVVESFESYNKTYEKNPEWDYWDFLKRGYKKLKDSIPKEKETKRNRRKNVVRKVGVEIPKMKFKTPIVTIYNTRTKKKRFIYDNSEDWDDGTY